MHLTSKFSTHVFREAQNSDIICNSLKYCQIIWIICGTKRDNTWEKNPANSLTNFSFLFLLFGVKNSLSCLSNNKWFIRTLAFACKLPSWRRTKFTTHITIFGCNKSCFFQSSILLGFTFWTCNNDSNTSSGTLGQGFMFIDAY